MTRTALALATALTFLLPGIGHAQSRDLQLWRLGDPRADPAANQRYEMLAVDLGLALTPTPLHPAETLGRSGFGFEVGLRVVDVHQNAAAPAAEGAACPTANPECLVWVTEGSEPGLEDPADPPGGLLLPVLQVRKGLPFSFELDGKLQWVPRSEMVAMTGGLRWALNEGLDFLPDVSVGGQVTRLVGNRDLGLTTAALDVMVGKWVGIGGMVQLAPYGGWQHVWIGSESRVIDFDPAGEIADDPTADDTAFASVDMGETAYDRFFIGLRAELDLFQLSVEGAWQPGPFDLADGFLFTTKIGLSL